MKARIPRENVASTATMQHTTAKAEEDGARAILVVVVGRPRRGERREDHDGVWWCLLYATEHKRANNDKAEGVARLVWFGE